MTNDEPCQQLAAFRADARDVLAAESIPTALSRRCMVMRPEDSCGALTSPQLVPSRQTPPYLANSHRSTVNDRTPGLGCWHDQYPNPVYPEVRQ